MICAACAQAADQRRTPHDRCPGETWCDCQHMPGRQPEPAAEPPDNETDKDHQ